MWVQVPPSQNTADFLYIKPGFILNGENILYCLDLVLTNQLFSTADTAKYLNQVPEWENLKKMLPCVALFEC